MQQPLSGALTWCALHMRSMSCLARYLETISGPKVKDTPLSFSPQPITSLSGSDHSKSHSSPTAEHILDNTGKVYLQLCWCRHWRYRKCFNPSLLPLHTYCPAITPTRHYQLLSPLYTALLYTATAFTTSTAPPMHNPHNQYCMHPSTQHWFTQRGH